LKNFAVCSLNVLPWTAVDTMLAILLLLIRVHIIDINTRRNNLYRSSPVTTKSILEILRRGFAENLDMCDRR